jgi:hypothetical protein
LREDRRARHIADSPFWCGRLGCRKRPALAELKSEEAVRHPSRRRGGVRVAGLSHDKRQGSSRRARSTTAMFSEDDRCAIGMRSAGRAKRRTSPQIPRRSSALGSCGTEIPPLLGVEKLVPTENRVRPARPQWGRASSAAGPDVRSPRMSRTSSHQASCLASAAVNVALNLRQCLPQIVPLDKPPSRTVRQTSPGFGPRRRLVLRRHL